MIDDINIYLDTIVFRIQKFGGASTYWKELLGNFIKLKNIGIVLQSENFNDLNNDGQEIVKQLNPQNKLLIEDKLPVALLRYLPFTKRLPAGSIYHSSYYRTCLQKSVINIFTVHDFTHKKGYASKFPRKLVHIGLTALGLKNADGIICISENTKRDLMYYYPQIPEKKIKVIYHGVGDDFYKIENEIDRNFKGVFNLDEPFVLFVGKRGGYKKFDIIPDAVKKVKNLKLLVVGGGAFSDEEIINLEKALPGRYYKLDGIDNAGLNILYNNAVSLIYTSLYEGFGIPLIEAMKAGCPVITNDLSSLGEVAGNAALFLNNLTSDALYEALSKLDDEILRADIIAKGFKQSAKFNWEKCFKETFLFYQEIYKQKHS